MPQQCVPCFSPDEPIARVERMSDLAFPVVVVGDEAGAARALVGDAPLLLASPVDLQRAGTGGHDMALTPPAA